MKKTRWMFLVGIVLVAGCMGTAAHYVDGYPMGDEWRIIGSPNPATPITIHFFHTVWTKRSVPNGVNEETEFWPKPVAFDKPTLVPSGSLATIPIRVINPMNLRHKLVLEVQNGGSEPDVFDISPWTARTNYHLNVVCPEPSYSGQKIARVAVFVQDKKGEEKKLFTTEDFIYARM